jgi:hypothetical protein
VHAYESFILVDFLVETLRRKDMENRKVCHSIDKYVDTIKYHAYVTTNHERKDIVVKTLV